jgi:two-component system, LuxR family, response regulator FixJ
LLCDRLQNAEYERHRSGNSLRNHGVLTPIILVTGHPDENIPGKAAVAGVHHVLLKPHLEESLVARIREALPVASR